MGLLPNWLKKILSSDEVDSALTELRRRLNEKGYDTDYPPYGSELVRKGLKVWVIIADPCNDERAGTVKTQEELMKITAEIREINHQVAAQFGIVPSDIGPVFGENALVFVYC